LKQGQNFMHVRAKIANGMWSPWQFQMFFIEDTSVVGKINKIEYFVDKDPGVNKATAQSIVAGDTVKTQMNQGTAALNPGQHFFHARAKTANGLWSPWQLQMIYVDDTTETGPVSKIEYFVDKDPGIGKATALSFIPADTLKKQFHYNSSSLSIGQHFMHVRSKTKFGLWSPNKVHMFFVEALHDTAKIISFKYSIDSSLQKPAYVKTVKLNLAADSIKKTHIEKTDTALKFGNHFFRIWAQTSNRLSSTWHRDTFTVIDCPMLDTAIFSFSGRPCAGDTFKFKQDITKLGIWSKDTFSFQWKVNGTLLSSIDSFRYRHSGSTDSFKLLFSFNRKSDNRCKGSLERTFYIYKTPKDTFKSNICAGDSIRIHSAYRKTAGTYLYTGTSKRGCDSFSTVILTIKPSYKDTLRKEICGGDSINIHGVFRKSAGTYIRNGKTYLGCDSVVTTILKVNPVYRKTDTIALCSGDTLKIHGKRYSATGTYRDSFKTKKGCDSLFTTRVIVNPTFNTSSNRSICSGDSSLIHGIWRKIAGSYQLNGKTTKGCDSLSNVFLKLNPVYNYSIPVEICSGDSLKIHGIIRKSAGTYIRNGKTYLGCDSIVTITLKVNPVYYRTDTFAICNGDTLAIHGSKYTIAGVYTNPFKTIKGCDSLFTTRLILNPTYNITTNRGLCGGDSFFFDANWRKKTGTFIGKFFTKKGCDSTVTLKLTIDSIIHSDDYPLICQGDSMRIGGIYRKTAGTYTDLYKAFKGCDSLATRYLKFIPRDTTYLNATICQREIFDFHGQLITDSGSYKAILRNNRGCDSVLFIQVKKRPESRHAFAGTVCFGAGFFAGNGLKFGSGAFFDTLTDRFGCDSVVIYTQTERKKDTFAVTTSICNGDSLFTGNTWKKKAGTFLETLTNRHGCDSFVTTNVAIRPTSFKSTKDTICFGSPYNFLGTIITEPGIYSKTLTNFVGCDSIIELNLFRRNQFIPRIISLNFALLSTDKPYKTYQWNKNRISLPSETTRTITVKASGIYDVSVTDSLGCGANSWDDLLSNSSFAFVSPIQIYPNPANSIVYVESTVNAEIDVFNSTGVHITTQKLNPEPNRISSAYWPEGVYQFRFRLNHFVYSTSVVVLH